MTRQTADQPTTLLAGRYLPIRTLGRGEMAGVWLVSDTMAPDPPLALKRLQHAADPEMHQLLWSEFQLLRQLRHPHLAEVCDFGQLDDGATYFTQRYCPGTPLSELDRKRWPELRDSVTAQLIDTLEYLHHQGVVHGDLKPEHLILEPGGTLRVLDFGLSGGSQQAVLGGTPLYLPPESLAGQPGGAERDLYALGVVLWQLETGSAPFSGEIAELMQQKQNLPALESPEIWLKTARWLLEPQQRKRLVSLQTLRQTLDLSDRQNLRPFARTRELIGRKDLLQELSGSASVVLRGLPGVGKRRLLEAAELAALKAGSRVVRLRGMKSSGPLACWRPLLDLAEAQKRFPTSSNGAEAEELSGISRAEAQRRMLVGLAGQIVSLASGQTAPLLVIIEALDGCGPLSLELYQTLLQADCPKLRILASGDYHSPLWPQLADWNCRIIDLGPLSTDDVARFAAASLALDRVPHEFVCQLEQYTAGLPLSLEEQMFALLQRGLVDIFAEAPLREAQARVADLSQLPSALSLMDSWRGLLDELSASEQRLLLLLSLADVPLPAALSVQLTDCRDWTRLVEQRLIDRRLSGQHSLVDIRQNTLRAAVLQRSEPATVRKLASALLLAIDEHPDSGLPGDAEWLAGLAWRAGDTAREADLLLIAAREQRALFEHQAAATLYARLLERDPERLPDVFAELAQTLKQVADADQLKTICQLAANHIKADDALLGGELRDDSPAIAGQLILAQSELDFINGDFQQAARRCGTAARQSVDPILALQLTRLGVRALSEQGQFPKARQLALTLIERSDEPEGYTLLGTIEFSLGKLDAAEQAYRQALEGYERHPNPYQMARVHYNLAIMHYHRHDVGLTRHRLELARELADQHRFIRYQILSRNLAGILAQTEEGDYHRALTEYEQSHRHARSLNDLKLVLETAGNIVRIELLLGRFERGRSTWEWALDRARRAHSLKWEGQLLEIGGLLELSARRLDLAAAHFSGVERLNRETGEALKTATVLAMWPRLLRLQGKAEQALTAADRAWELAIELEAEDCQVEILLSRGATLLSLERLDEAKSPLQQVETFWERFRRHEWGWEIPFTLGQLYERSGRQTTARRYYKTAYQVLLELADRLPEDLRGSYLFAPDRRDAAAFLKQELEEPASGDNASYDSQAIQRMLTITAALNSETELDRLLEFVMDSVIELTEAERGFLLLANDAGQLTVRTARAMDQHQLDPEEYRLSLSVAHQVAAQGIPIFTVDAQNDERFDTSRSVHTLRLRAIIAFPLRVKGRVVGTIYLDNRQREAAFTHEDLPFLTALGDQAGIAIENAALVTKLRAAQQRLRRENNYLRREIESAFDVEGIIGSSKQLGEVLHMVKRVAGVPSSVLIRGESGTGKELIARAIHRLSDRADKPLIKVNCAALAETLLESELFGHERGAFTGAERRRIGHFELADGGTIFLDEIGDISLSTQTRLLRVLQEQEITRVGGGESIKLDVRVVAATNRPLERMIESGDFRQDLFYRLNVFPILIPPLRDRKEDVPVLVQTFLTKFRQQIGRAIDDVHPLAMDLLMDYDWPGNVRELEHVVERAVILADSPGLIRPRDLPPELTGPRSLAQARATHSVLDEPFKQLVDKYKRQLIRAALAESGGNRTKAAEKLGVQRRHLYLMMDKLSVQ